MRTFTVTTATPGQTVQRVWDMPRGSIIQLEDRGDTWHLRTDEDESPVVRFHDGCLCTAMGMRDVIVTRVLAPNETLTIGAEVTDG